MIAETRTDREQSSASGEFAWDVSGNAASHEYLLKPVISTLRRHRTRRLLDLGCGNGAFTHHLGLSGFETTGLDSSCSGIEIARRTFPEVKFAQHDLMEPLPIEHALAYDAVVAVEVIEHLLLPRKLMTAALTALRPGGLLVVTTPFHGYWKNLALALTGGFDAHWHPLRDFGHIKFFSRRTLDQLFEEFGLKQTRFDTAGRVPALAKSMIMSGTKAR